MSNDLLRVGCGMIAYAPACSLLILFSKRPQLIIVSLAAAFSWLCSSLLTSIIWWFIKLSNSNVWSIVIISSAIIQEGLRYIFVIAYRKTEFMIKRSSPHSNNAFPLNDLSSSLAAGIGFGLMHSLLFYGSVLASSDGVGVYFDDSCPTTPLILVLAITSLGFFILDVIWTCLFFLVERYRSKILASVVVLLHIFAGLTTLTNIQTHGCQISLSLLLVIVIISAGLLVIFWPLLTKNINQNN